MTYRKHLGSICLAILMFTSMHAQQPKPDYTIAHWRDNKKAALSLTFDDAINGQFTIALPMLNKYGFRSTFFIIASLVQPQLKGWQLVVDAAKSGHEIANHTLNHPHLHALTADSIAYQLVECNKLIAQYIPSQTNFTHAYPYGDGGGETDSERVVRAVAKKYFTGARAVRNNKLPYNIYGFAKTEDDYYKVNSDMIADAASMTSFASHLDETIQAGGWYVPTYHGIENGWIIVPAVVFAKHLEQVNARKADLWIAPFGDVIKYHKERNSAVLKIAQSNKHSVKLMLTDTLADNGVYNQPLTINLSLHGRLIKNIEQAGVSLPFTVAGNVITFNAVPGKDAVELSSL